MAVVVDEQERALFHVLLTRLWFQIAPCLGFDLQSAQAPRPLAPMRELSKAG